MKPRLRKKFLLFLIGGCGIFVAFRFWVYAGTPRAQSLFIAPVRWFSNAGVTVSRWFSRPNTTSFRLENERLWALLRARTIDESQRTNLLASYEALAALVRFNERIPIPFVAGRVIGKSSDPFHDGIYIDRGLVDGIKADAAVIAYDGIYVGSVMKSWEHVALVQLVSDKQRKTPAKVLGREGAFGIIEGAGALYTFSLVPRSAPIAEGDTVVTEQFGTAIPANLPIGIILSVEEQDESPFKTAFITPLADTRQLNIVGVLSGADIPL